MAYEIERQVAIEAVIKACRLCSQVRSTLVTEESIAKKDKSPVTVADFGAQAIVNHRLRAAFPNDPIVGEEDSAQLRSPEGAELAEKVFSAVGSVEPGMTLEQMLHAIDDGQYAGGARGRHWSLDPIDGTKGFLRNEQYAVALALIEDGEPVVGVLGCPNLLADSANPAAGTGCLFVAVRGGGAFTRALSGGEWRPVNVTGVTSASEASFCESVESGHSSHGDAEKIAEALGVTNPPIRMDSQCKYAAIARGDASIYLRLPTRADYEEKIWDHAAGWLVVKEAGGEVSDIRGKALDFSIGRTLKANSGVVASNGAIHAEVIRAVRQVLEAA